MPKRTDTTNAQSRAPLPVEDGGRGQPSHDVFVSYSSQDKPTADAIVSRLEQAGIRCWEAPRDVIPGKVWGEAIVEAIETSRLMVVVLSGNSNQSRHVHREVERAVANDVVVIPFRIESVELSGAMAYYLASEHWLDAMTPPLDAHIARLVRVAEGLLRNMRTPDTDQAPIGPAPQPSGQVAPRGAKAWRSGRPRWLVPTLIGAGLAAVLGLAAALLIVFVFSGSGHVRPTMTPLASLAAGDCVQTPQAYANDTSSRLRFWTTDIPWPASMPVVPCSAAHSGEVFFAGNIWPGSQAYPGDNAVSQQQSNRCDRAFENYVGIVFARSELNWVGSLPDRNSWTNGDRRIFCIAYDPTGKDIKGTIKNSQR